MANNADLTLNNELFQKAVEIFFGKNPKPSYSILAVFYMAYRRYVSFEKNYDLNSPNVLSWVKINDVSPYWSEMWGVYGVENQALVIDDEVPEDEVRAINVLFYDDSHDNTQDVRWIDFILIQVTYNFLKLSGKWYEVCAFDAFEYLLRRLQSRERGESADFFQPKEITDLVIRLLDAESGSVYNPYAGVCSYGIMLNENVQYTAQELNPTTHAVGLLRMKTHQLKNATYILEDSVSQWRGAEGYNYIVASPPFHAVADSKYIYTDLDFFVRSAHDSMHKAVGVYSTTMLFPPVGKRADFISIVRDDLIESVILLPENIFNSVSIPAAVIIVNKMKPRKRSIRFIDASSQYHQDEKNRKRTITPHLIVDFFNASGDIKGVVIDVDLDEVISNDCNLNPQLYLSETLTAPDGFSVHSLGEYLYMLPMTTVEAPVNGRILSLRMISKGFLPKDIINSSDIPVIEDNGKKDLFSVDRDCLVVSSLSHPVYVVVNEKPLYLTRGSRAFRVDTARISPQYIMDEMSKPYFHEQLKKFNRGSRLLPKITESDLLKTKILVPEKQQDQENLVLESERAKLILIEQELRKDVEKRLDDFVIGQRERKHAVAQVLNEIVPSVDNITDFIFSHENVSKDDILSSRFGTTLEYHLLRLKQRLDKVVDMVDNFTSLEKFGSAEEIDLYSFLSEYCESKRDNGKCELVFEQEEEELEEGEEPTRFLVSISRKDFTQILDNLYANAMTHGFVDDERKDYQIQFKPVRKHGPNPKAHIRVSNNGIPVSKSISLDKIFVWGEGSGTGIGCWQIKEIANHFGGSVTYAEYPDEADGFVSEFTIVLPLIEEE